MPILLAIVLGLLGAAVVLVLIARGPGRRGSGEERFSARGPLLSPQERAFAAKLELAMNGRYHVSYKVSLDRIVEPGHSLSDAARAGLRQRLHASCLDFVLADGLSWDVLAAIQLEPRGVRSAARREERDFVANALRSANIHLLGFAESESYSAAYLAAQIESILAKDFIETLSFLPPDEGSTTPFGA